MESNIDGISVKCVKIMLVIELIFGMLTAVMPLSVSECEKGQRIMFPEDPCVHVLLAKKCLWENGEMYWPPDRKCYQKGTKGPCMFGEVVDIVHHTEILKYIWPICRKKTEEDSASNVPSIETQPRVSVGNLQERSPLSLQEKCYNEGKILWEEDDQCYILTTTGPCDPGFWLVLDAEADEPIPVCKKKPCGILHALWKPTGQCYSVYQSVEIGICNKGHTLSNDLFGNGVCTCKSDPPHFHWEPDGNCYELYRQGPCEPGFYFNYNQSSQLFECQRNPCKVNDYVKWSDGNCYRLFTRGPCNSTDEVLQVSPLTVSLDCVSEIRHIIRVPTKQNGNCQYDLAGICRPVIRASDIKVSNKWKDFINSLFE